MTLLGRDDELAVLVAALQAVASGRAHTVLIEGEAGIGKSRLIEEAQTEAERLGFQVFSGRAEELERMRPFGAIADALAGRDPSSPAEEAMRALVRESTATEVRLIDAFLDLMEERAIASPVALVVEDLHWADPGTLAALRSVSRRLAYLPILIVGTHRPHPETDELARLIDASSREGATTLVLGPLADGTVTGLAEDVLGMPIGESLARALTMASGNPLYVTELVRGLHEQGAITITDGAADAEVEALPATLRITILRRLSFLPAETIEVLRYAAVVGSTVGAEELAAVTEHTVPAVIATLAPALASKVLLERKTGMSFRHDLIREAIYQDIPESVRASMHVEAAKALLSFSGSQQQAAEHLLRGVHKGTQDLLDLMLEIAKPLRHGAPRLAVELTQRVIELRADPDAEADKLRAHVLLPMARVGRGADALVLAEQMLSRSQDLATEARIRLARNELLATDGRAVERIPELTLLADDPRFPDVFRRRVRATLASFYVRTGQAARLQAEQIITEARASDDHQALAVALTCLGTSLGLLGMPTEGIPHLTEALAVHQRFRTYLQIPHAQLALQLFMADRLEDARRVLDEGGTRDREAGDISSLAAITLPSAWIAFLEGRWDDALTESMAYFEMLEEGIGTSIGEFLARSLLAQIRCRRGDLAGAERAVADGRDVVARKGRSLWAECVDWCASDYLDAAGDPSGALERALAAWEPEVGPYSVGARLLGPNIVRLALAFGRSDQARGVARDAEEAARRAHGVPSAEGAALRCRGLLEEDPEILLDAVEWYRKSPRIYERALTIEDAAVAVARAGKKAEATALFKESVAVYEDVGAARDIARAVAAMRTAGIRTGSRASPRRETFGWGALTASERTVAELAAQGLTNRQIAERLFVSKYTVMTHLSHVFTKLGLSSRVELAAAAARASPS